MHQTLHAIRTGFISITVNNNDKYIFFWGLSGGYQRFKYTFNQGGNLPLVLLLLLLLSAWELLPPAQNGAALLSQQIILDGS